MDAFTPLLILFCLAVLGASELLSDRKMRKFNRRMEWKARETWLRLDVGMSATQIQEFKDQYFSDVK